MSITTKISETAKAEIDQWIAKYPSDQKQSAVMQALSIVQAENSGSLTTELMDAVADYLEMPKIAVYEVATFYSMYELKPIGKYKIEVCTNISCGLCDADKILKHLEHRLGVAVGETTSDNKITLREAECLGACVHAPVMQIGKNYYEKLTPEKVDEILEQLN